MKDKKPVESDDESAASSDTDSFVHVDGSVATNSDSEWEKVGSFHGSESGESDGDFEEEEEEEEEQGYEINDYDDLDDGFKIPSVIPNKFPSTLPSTTTTSTTTTTTTSTSNTNSNNNNNNNNNNNINNYNQLNTINSNNYINSDLSASKFHMVEDEEDDDEMLKEALRLSLLDVSPKADSTHAPNSTLAPASISAPASTPASASAPTPAPTPAPAPASAPASESTPAPPPVVHDENDVWGYHYLAESVYEQIKEDRTVKSAYVLFHEYMECPVHLRSLHAWKRVYHAYLADAAKWNGARGKHKVENLTDTDVYAFLVWRSAESFAKLDVTAGPRAIYFSWTPMPTNTWRDTLEIDKIMGEDLRNPTICDRYARVIRINLSKLCDQHKGVMHRVQLKDGVMDSNHWLPTTLREATAIKTTNLWKEFEPGSSFFNCVPHGCVVMPGGSIPWECIDILETMNNASDA